MSELIYRVETPNGRGMYLAGFLEIHADIYNEGVDYDIQPPPSCDDNEFYFKWENLINPRSYRFGFASKEQFMKWTRGDKCREMLNKNGLIVSVYEVESKFTFSSSRQAVFKKSKSTILEKMTVREFMKKVK